MLKIDNAEELLYNGELDELKIIEGLFDLKEVIFNKSKTLPAGGSYFVLTYNTYADGKSYVSSAEIKNEEDILLLKRAEIRADKLALYKALNYFTGINPPWGSLTGIRPTKLAYELIDEGIELIDVPQKLSELYGVSDKKANLAAEVLKNQRDYINLKGYNLYVHIPFCPSKCSYCSFISETVKKSGALIPEYAKRLKEDIDSALDLALNLGQNLSSIYVGGGTPTTFSADELYFCLNRLKKYGVEFTVEAGRPDSIDEEKLACLKECGVTRVCVNPQSFNLATLKEIGRSHTVEDFYQKFDMARKFGFDINIDLIAGLSGETEDMFMYSVKSAAALKPENITVHTLSIKNGAKLFESGVMPSGGVSDMTENAYDLLCVEGYSPYYLYRQKRMLDNLENIGYSLKGKQCANNITVMEEKLSVIGCGAGAISKRVFDGGRIERLSNLRDIRLYLSQFSERLIKRAQFFD